VDRSIDVRPVVIVGLGRFGGALARDLADRGIDVQGVDIDRRVVADAATRLRRAVVADGTRRQDLAVLELSRCRAAVVAVGSDLEATWLTTSQLADHRVRDIWAVASRLRHASVLRQLGAHHVIGRTQPVSAVAARIAT
jgi:trk system potassium uptake protein TrkA